MTNVERFPLRCDNRYQGPHAVGKIHYMHIDDKHGRIFCTPECLKDFWHRTYWERKVHAVDTTIGSADDV